MKFILIGLMLLSSLSYAQDDQWVIGGGLGIFNSAKNSLAETKMLSLGIQEDVWYPLKDRFTIGGFIDNAGNGRTGSGFAAGQLGFEVNNKGTVGSVFFGPGAITSPDIYLGGYFQFMADFHLGIQDNQNNYIGVMYRHISSAGIEMPNIGRDFMGLEIRY